MIEHFENLGEKIANSFAVILVKAQIRPITVTFLRFFVAVPVSIYFFGQGKYFSNIIGLFIYIFLALFDWVDGKMAELYKLPQETAPLGRFIDRALDKILVLFVLGSIFFAYLNSNYFSSWIILTILFYSSYFFVTAMHDEFNNSLNLDFAKYHVFEKQVIVHKPNFKFADWIFLFIICIHRNSLSKFFFSISYPLFLGILFNAIYISFIFITIIQVIRGFGLFYLLGKIYNPEKINSVLINSLQVRYNNILCNSVKSATNN